MSANSDTLFEAFLNRYDDDAWRDAVQALLPHIHEADRNAVEIWFYFFPLALAQALQEADDPAVLVRDLGLSGRHQLKDQIDSSHEFLYGHRYWPEVKRAVMDFAASSSAPASLELEAQIREVAGIVAPKVNAPPALLVAMVAIGFNTLQQVGLAAFSASPGILSQQSKSQSASADQVVRRRARDDRQGLFGFLKGPEKVYTVTFNENEPDASFKLISSQHLTTAAACDKREYYSREPRCIPGEGPIPVQCRAAVCGTCWVGVLAGAEKLSEVSPRESRKIKEFGYISTDEPKPLIRLSCMAQAYGAVSIVIPPWSGVFGKFIRARKESDRGAVVEG